MLETGLLGGAHCQLVQVHDPSVHAKDCYLYDTSTENQRIEALVRLHHPAMIKPLFAL